MRIYDDLWGTMRRGIAIFATTALLMVTTPAATAWELEWVRDERRMAEDVALDAHGNTYVSGSFDCDVGIEPMCEAFLTKFGPAGGLLWGRVWDPKAAHFTRGKDVAVGEDGTVYWSGEVASNDDFGPSSWWLRALSPRGRLLWRREQPWRTEFHRTTVTDVAVGSGLVALTTVDWCWECNDFEAHLDAHVIAYSTGGAFLWERPFDPLRHVPHSYSERATGVAVSALDNVYVVGWGARSRDGRSTRAGTVVLSKLAASGGVVWTRRVFRLPDPYNGGSPNAHVAARGDRVMLATTSHPGTFHQHDPQAWLGRFTPGGSLAWVRAWGTDRAGAEPAEVAIDGSLRTWVVGTVRDVAGDDLDVFVRAYSTRGALVRSLSRDVRKDSVHGRGIAADGGAVAFSGQYGRQGRSSLTWRYST